MTKDARFEDGAPDALKLAAETAEDLQVISTLSQDAVFAATEMEYSAKDRRFAILLNRFRWEDARNAPSGFNRCCHLMPLHQFDQMGSIARTPIRFCLCWPSK